MYIKTGSTLFTRSTTLSSRVIAWATRARWEGPTLATHQGKIINIEVGCTILSFVVEASAKENEVVMRPLEDAVRGVEFAIVSPCTDMLHPSYYADVRMMVGWRYAHRLLPLYLFDGLISKMCGQHPMGIDRIVARKLMPDWWKAGVVCSTTANRVDVKYGLLPPILRYASPDDTWDHMNKSSEWVVVAWSEGWYK